MSELDGLHVSGGQCFHGPQCSGTGPECGPDWLDRHRDEVVQQLADQASIRAITGDRAELLGLLASVEIALEEVESGKRYDAEAVLEGAIESTRRYLNRTARPCANCGGSEFANGLGCVCDECEPSGMADDR